MKGLFRNLVVIFVLGISAFSFSSSVAILMGQHDDEIDTLRETTYLVEKGVVDILYDAGYIISSMPTIINGENDEALEKAVESAKNGYMEYVLHIIVYYITTDPVNSDGVIFKDIEGVDIKIVRTYDASLVYEEKNMIPIKNAGAADISAINRFSRQLGLDIQRILYENF